MAVGIMTGYGIHIRQLTQDDVDRWHIDLQGNPVEQCLAIDGVDLGDCLAAAVLWDEAAPKVLWYDNGLTGTVFPTHPEWEEEDMAIFAQATVTLARAIHTHLRDV